MNSEDHEFADCLDESDPILSEMIANLLSQGISEEEIEATVAARIPDAIEESIGPFLANLMAAASSMLADRERIRTGFQKRQCEKWGKPLDLLMMLKESAHEIGEERNTFLQRTPGIEQDFIFDALRKLHARGCLLTSEIHDLLQGGYASGAMARWRTLHEITVIASFIRQHGQEIAERYLLHHQVEAYRSAVQYNENAERLKATAFGETE